MYSKLQPSDFLCPCVSVWCIVDGEEGEEGANLPKGSTYRRAQAHKRRKEKKRNKAKQAHTTDTTTDTGGGGGGQEQDEGDGGEIEGREEGEVEEEGEV
jgi:hypothetical protein